MTGGPKGPEPARLLAQYCRLFIEASPGGPILDLACGDGHNGIFLASHGLSVICCDTSSEALDRAGRLASMVGVTVSLWQVDLEREGINPLREDFYAGVLVFRYLHRPLIPCIRKSIKGGGILMYETFTVEQPGFGKPQNPDFLLQHGELKGWFDPWQIIHAFEGIEGTPPRAIAQLVARKPETRRSIP